MPKRRAIARPRQKNDYAYLKILQHPFCAVLPRFSAVYAFMQRAGAPSNKSDPACS
jgi:hypothetical protein